jgi:hypothetical protein
LGKYDKKCGVTSMDSIRDQAVTGISTLSCGIKRMNGQLSGFAKAECDQTILDGYRSCIEDPSLAQCVTEDYWLIIY